jgi:predicted XRE-type DNA-binding protein
VRYPSKKELRRIDKLLRDVPGTLMVNEDSTPLEKFRWDLCQNIVRHMRINSLSQVDLAKILEIDQARVSEVVHHRIDKVSADKLMAYNEKLNPKVRFKIV